VTLAFATGGCAIATVGEDTATSSAALVAPTFSGDAGADADAAGPPAATCGTRFVGAGVETDAGASGGCTSAAHACATIAQAIAAACAGDVVVLGPGTFTENVVVDKPVSLVGAGDATIIVPARSAPAPCDDSSLCGGAASSVVLVRASGVTIAHLAIDGDNPALTSGTVVRGADVDARNGIVTGGGGPYDDLEVRDVTVRDVFLRGIEATSGGTFVFDHDRVANLSSDDQSVAIFNTGGAGTIEGNVVLDAMAGIATNQSRGTRIAFNEVARSSMGIHSDNAGLVAGSAADVVEGNVVRDCLPDGFGIWSFAPYVPVTVLANRVRRCAVGLAELGQNAAVRDVFVENLVDGASLADSVGLFVTTSLEQYGSSNVAVQAARNTIENASVGVYVEEQSGFTATVDLECDALSADGEAIAGGGAVKVRARPDCAAPTDDGG
jgi:hypothetical protein